MVHANVPLAVMPSMTIQQQTASHAHHLQSRVPILPASDPSGPVVNARAQRRNQAAAPDVFAKRIIMAPMAIVMHAQRIVLLARAAAH